MSMDTNTITIPLGDPGGDDALLLMRAPTDSHGGGIRIIDAYAVNHAATSGTVAFAIGLHKYSSAGTPAVNGTIAAAIGGTADHWADSVPKQFTVDSDYSFLDAGEWLAVDYAETNAGSPTNGFVTVHYLNGR